VKKENARQTEEVAGHFHFCRISTLSLAVQETTMLTTVFACPSIISASAFGNMNRVAEGAAVPVLTSSAVVDYIELAHRLFPFSLHIPARSRHLYRIRNKCGIETYTKVIFY
jgi:hypothetical protein